MINGVVYSNDNNQPILTHVMKTSSVFERMQGLLCREPIKENEGLLIQPCSSIHTIGMRYDIDVVFLNNDFTIKKICKHVKPWRCAMSFGAAMVLEMIAGSVEKLGLDKNGGFVNVGIRRVIFFDEIPESTQFIFGNVFRAITQKPDPVLIR